MNIFKKNKKIILTITLAILFFVAYSFLSWSQIWGSDIGLSEVSMRYNTPDEVVSSFFTDHYRATGDIFYNEPMNEALENIIFPRWARPAGCEISLGAFQGLVLVYSNISKIIGAWSVPFLTAFFALMAVLFFYLIIKKYFGGKVASISSLLLMIFPGFWYYAGRPFFHNILFLACFLAGFYCLLVFVSSDEKKKILWSSLLFGLAWGLALITRTSEAVWMFGVLLIIFFFNLKRFKSKWYYLGLSLLVVIICFLPVFANNRAAYGSALAMGYDSRVSSNIESGEVSQVSFIQALLLPFGFHPRVMISHVFSEYLWQNFYPWFILAFGGLVAFLKRRFYKNKQQLQFLVVGGFVFLWLFVYYGSWFFHDSVTPGVTSLGSSYIRYFLPAYVFGVLLVGLLIASVSDWLQIKGKILLAKLTTGVFLILLLVSSFTQVYLSGPESLTAIRGHLLDYRQQANAVIEATSADDIFLVDVAGDKVIFPERKRVIVPQDGTELELIKQVIDTETVWFFYRTYDVDPEYLNETKFWPHGLEVYDKQDVGGAGLFMVKTLH